MAVEPSAARDLFEQALDLEPPAREAFVREHAGGDDALIERVLELLRHACDSSAVLPSQAGELVPRTVDSYEDWVGKTIDGFEVVGFHARGGMGVVFEAMQAVPQRRVALKTLLTEGLEPALEKRLALEAEVLGRLNHPNIAQVYGAGRIAGGGGTPYIAMELVAKAKDLTSFALEAELALGERLDLFADVCAAVGHAHHSGIIHRDLKPANLLVNEDGVVKVIDFGLARVNDPEAYGISKMTLAGGVMGTLEYMSPEHLSGDPLTVDVRSDVFSLGCVLIELVSGERPRGLEGLPLGAALSRAQQEEPRIPAEVSGDLRWILRRALEPRPEQRYASVPELVADIERMRRGESVLAARSTAVYTVSKAVRRYRAAMLVSAAILLALGFGLVRERTAADRADAAARRATLALASAERELAVSHGVTDFFDRLFSDHHLFLEGSDVRLSEVIRESLPAFRDVEDSIARARLTSIVCGALLATEEYETAREYLSDAMFAIRAELPNEDPDRMRAEFVALDLAFRTRELETVVEQAPALLTLLERELGPDHPDANNLRSKLIAALQHLGRNTDALELARIHWQRMAANENEPCMGRVDAAERLAACLGAQSAHAEANLVLESALDLALECLPEGNTYPNSLRNTLGINYAMAGDDARAGELFREALEGFLSGESNPQNVLATRMNLLELELARGRSGEQIDLDEAEAIVRAVLDEAELIPNSELSVRYHGHRHLATVCVLRGELAEAGGYLEEALAVARRTFGPQGPLTLDVAQELARVTAAQGDPQAGHALLAELTDGLIELDGDATNRRRAVSYEAAYLLDLASLSEEQRARLARLAGLLVEAREADLPGSGAYASLEARLESALAGE